MEQLRLAHGRPLIINETQLLTNLEELRAKAAAHVLVVRTMDGRRVDLTTLEPAALPSQPPKPNFPLDSVNNDQNFPGVPGHFLGNTLGGDELTMPQVLEGDAKPALFKDAALQVESLEGAIPPAPPVPMDVDALVDAAQAEGEEGEGEETAPTAKEEVSSDKSSKGGSKKKGR